MTHGVLWDSSAILALLDADDGDHARAVAAARQIASEARPSFVTNYIEVEAHALLLRKLGRAIASQWLFHGGLPVVRALPVEEERAKEILARHRDKDWTLCDAISFAVLDARRVRRAFTFVSSLSTVRADSGARPAFATLTRGIRSSFSWRRLRAVRANLQGAPGSLADANRTLDIR